MGVDLNDFSLVTTGIAGATVASVAPISGSNDAQYAITVTTGTGSGTLELNFSGAGIQDIAGNPLPAGTFQNQTQYATETDPVAVVTGDLNGDGRPDLGVANAGSNSVSILLGNDDGTFQAQTSYTVDTDAVTATPADSVAIADLNGDGKLDLAVVEVNGLFTFLGKRVGGGVDVATGESSISGKRCIFRHSALE